MPVIVYQDTVDVFGPTVSAVAGWTTPTSLDIVRVRRRAQAPGFAQGAPWQGNVPTAFVANAWVAAWDGPARKRFPATLHPPTGDQFIGNVPTAATAQGWWAVYPDRFKRPIKPALQQFDLPVLAAYGTVVVTYPDGWQVIIPDRFARGSQSRLQQFDVPALSPAVTYGVGWQVTVPEGVRRRPMGAAGQEISPPPPVVIWGFPATFPDQIRATVRSRQVGDFIIGTVTTADFIRGWSVEMGPPSRSKRLPAADLLWPPTTPPVVATPGNTDLWSSISHRFRRITPPPPDYARVLGYTIAVRIVSQPSLIGVSTNPTLLGVSTNPTLLGEV